MYVHEPPPPKKLDSCRVAGRILFFCSKNKLENFESEKAELSEGSWEVHIFLHQK